MQALKLSDADYLLIDKVKYPGIRFRHLADVGFNKINKCLLFGMKASAVGLNVQLPGYVFNEIAGVRLMASDPAHLLMNKDMLKRALWAELQKMYA